jgi:hypothetical protein
MAMRQYLEEQVTLGFNPAYMVSLHYQHPTEHGWIKRETHSPTGYGDRYSFTTNRSIWSEVSLYRHFEKHRKDLDKTIKDGKYLMNLIYRNLYGIRWISKERKRNRLPNILKFDEMGRYKVQYHSHLLIPSKGLKQKDEDEIKKVLNNLIEDNKLQCASKTKPIDVRPIYDIHGILCYLNKETKHDSMSFDPHNSTPIIPKQHEKDNPPQL